MGGARVPKNDVTRVILKQTVEAPSEITVGGDEHHYLTRVRRHREGDSVEVRGADGRCFFARVSRVAKHEATLDVVRPLTEAAPVYEVTLAVAAPKRHLMDDVVRKLSEVGVERLVPMISDRSVVRPGDDKVARWRRIADESMRQCGRNRPLAVEAPTTLTEVLRWMEPLGQRFILHPGAELYFPKAALSAEAKAPIVIMIGPEGGFTDEEVKEAKAAGVQAVKLCMPILRLETAAIASAVLAVSLLASNPKHSPP